VVADYCEENQLKLGKTVEVKHDLLTYYQKIMKIGLKKGFKGGQDNGDQ
jgi:hypothetical protein